MHGRYFEDMLARVLAQIRPSSSAEWLECIHQTMEAQNSLTRRCGYSLFRLAIGRGPELPGDLLQDLPNVISSSSILHDDVAAHTARIRSNARLAVMQLSDNLATRRALDQRPRPFRRFSLGDEVAVWRRGTSLRAAASLCTPPKRVWTLLTTPTSSQVMSPTPTTSRRHTSSPIQSP